MKALLAVVCCCCSVAQATELRIGVNVGVHLSVPSSSDLIEDPRIKDKRFGFIDGLHLDWTVTENFSFVTEILYIDKSHKVALGKKRKVKGTLLSSEVSLKYLDFPFFFRAQVPIYRFAPYALAGLSYSFRFSATEVIEREDSDDETLPVAGELNRHRISAIGGAGLIFNISTHFAVFLEARLERNLYDLALNSGTYNETRYLFFFGPKFKLR